LTSGGTNVERSCGRLALGEPVDCTLATSSACDFHSKRKKTSNAPKTIAAAIA
jgi:hypothetical protein